MSVSVVELFKAEVRSREANIRLSIHPNGKRVPRGNEHPLPDVKLSILHDECVLDVLLTNVLRFFLFADVKDLHQVPVQNNASTT